MRKILISRERGLIVFSSLLIILIGQVAFSQISSNIGEIKSLIEMKRFEEVKEKIRGLKAGLGDQEELHRLGQMLIEKRQYGEAIEIYKKLLEINSNDVNAYFWLGTLYRWGGKIDESIEAYSHAINRDPNHLGALVGRARIWILKRDDVRGEQDLIQAFRLTPKSQEVNEVLAELYFNRGDFKKGESYLKNVYQGGGLHKALGDQYKRKKKYAQAIREYDQALKLGFKDPELFRSLGELYKDKGNLRKSTQYYKKVIEQNPNDVDARFWLGTLYRWRGMLKESEKEFREALKIDPNHVGAMVGLARGLNYYGRINESIELSKKAVSLAPQNSEVRSVLGGALESNELFIGAQKEFSEGFQLNPKDEEAWRGIGRLNSLLEPSLGGNFSYYDSKVLEGRELPSPYPIKTRYWGYRFNEEAKYPVSSKVTLWGSSDQFRDVLDHLDGDFTIYDVKGYSAKLGGEYRIAPRWRLNVEVGEAWFKSNTDKPVNKDQLFLTRDEITFDDKEHRFLGKLGFQGGYLLGRSIGGTFDFALFAENRFFSHLEKRWGDNWSWKGDLSYSFFSDHTKTFFGYTMLDFSRDIHGATLYGGYYPLLSRFLETDDRLDFVKVGALGSIYRLRILPPLELLGEYRYQHYSDSNYEHFGRVGATYWFPCFKPLSVGVEYSIDDFQRESPKYASIDVDALTLFIRLKGTIIPHLDYDIRYAHSFKKDSIESYGSDEIFWNGEYFLNTYLRAGIGGSFTYNSLPEKIQRYWLYLKILF